MSRKTRLGRCVARACDKSARVVRKSQAHDVTSVTRKRGGLLARLHVPECAARIQYGIALNKRRTETKSRKHGSARNPTRPNVKIF